MADQRIVEVGTHGGDHRNRRRLRRIQQQVDEATDVSGVTGGPIFLKARRGCLGVQFLPLVDIQQQPVRLALTPIQFLTDHAGKQLGVTRPQLIRLRADFRGVFGAALVVSPGVEGHGQRFDAVHFPAATVRTFQNLSRARRSAGTRPA